MHPAQSDITLAADRERLLQQLKGAYDLRTSNLKESIRQTESLLAHFENLKAERLIASAKNNLGLFYLIQGEFLRAQKCSEEALAYFIRENDQKGIADAKYNIGSIHYRTNMYPQALLLLAESLAVYRALNDYYNQARTLKSMGTIYEYFGDIDKAVESYERSIDAAKVISELSLESNALSPLSAIYFKQGRRALALETVERAIQLKHSTGDERGLAFALYGRGKLLVKMGEAEKSIPDFEETIRIHLHAGDKLGLGMAYNKLGEAYMQLQNHQQARIQFEKSIELSDLFHVQLVRFKVEYNLYRLSKIEGNEAQALQHLEKFITHKEAVINKESYSVIKSYDAVKRIEDLEREAVLQQEKNQIIENKNAELDSFFYRVSHDLKGPISSLQGLYALTKLDVKDPVSQKYFEMYNSQVNRVHDIVIGLIHLTQLKHLEDSKVKIDFERLTHDCISSYSYLEHFKTIKFIKDIQVHDFASEWAIINTILQNLIENAIKYATRIEPFVKIVVAPEKNGIVIAVSDNGVGIAEAHQTKIFDMFYRASERTKGSGLGLYILKRAVERLNGTIELESTPHVGSTFRVFLPR